MTQAEVVSTAAVKAMPEGRKLLLFALTLLFPLITFGFVEVALRVIGYGPDLTLFTKEEFNGKEYYVLNQKASSRYFSRVEFNPNTSPDFFPVEKTDTTFRIFCLGGSTTAGFPYKFSGAFAPFLRDRLRAMFPERNIEVINLGMTATNSFTVLDIAEDLFEYKPDLLVVYDGHNEFYGALGIASHETLGRSRALTMLFLKLVHLKVFLLMRDAYAVVAGLFGTLPRASEGGTMMERLSRGQYIRYRSDEYITALEHFKHNLIDLKALCSENNVPIMIGTQASNLRDQPPFISQESERITEIQREAFGDAFSRGTLAFSSRDFRGAARNLQTALSQDSLRADVHYMIAHCYDSMGNKNKALQEYIKARDYDMLRFRASSDFNDAMREVADGKTMYFVDIERKLKANSPDSLIGNNLMMEHLHPNSKGAFLIAKEYQWMMHWYQIMATQDEWNARSNISDQALWENRTVTELDERAARRRVEILTSGWPFSQQEKPITFSPSDDTLGQVADAWVHGKISWERAHVEAAQFYAQRGEIDKEAREYRTLMKQMPLNVSPYLFLAKALLKQVKNEEAASVLLKSLDVEKTWFAYKTLGVLALDPPVAASFFQNALALAQDPEEMTETHFLLGAAFARDGKQDLAIPHLQQALELSPDFKPASDLLQHLSSLR